MREERKCASSLSFTFSRDRASEVGLAGASFGCVEMFATPPGISLIFPIDQR